MVPALCFSGQRSKVKSQAVQVTALPWLVLITATCVFTHAGTHISNFTIQSVPITGVNKADLSDNLSVVHQRAGCPSRRAEVNTLQSNSWSSLLHSAFSCTADVCVCVSCVCDFFFFGCNYTLRPRCSVPRRPAREPSERGDCCQLPSAWSPRPKGHRFKSHLSHTIDVCHLSWPAAGPNKDSLIGKG